MSLLDTLDELYASGNAPTVPDIDTGVRERARARREERPKERERERERDRDREREREREPLRKEARDSDTATLSPAAEAVVRRRRLIGAGLGAVVVALVVLLATGTFSSSSKKKSSSARTTTTAAQTQIIGRIPLTPAKSGVKASGNAFILQRGTQRVLVVQAKLPPLTQQQRTAAYEVWLYNSRTDVASIGAQFTDAQGNYQGAGPLPANFTRFKFVDISRQPFQPNTGHSGDSLLRGAFANIQPVQAGTTTPGTTTPGATPPGTTTPGTTTPGTTTPGTTPPGTGTTP